MTIQQCKAALVIALLLVAARAQPLDYPLETRQATTSTNLGALLLTAIMELMSALTTNLSSAITNAMGATMAGNRLELIPVEVLMGTGGYSGPPRDSAPQVPLERRRRYPSYPEITTPTSSDSYEHQL